MTTQINLRLPDEMLEKVKNQSKKKGYGSVQDFIKETLRKELYEKEITREEYDLVKKLAVISEKKNLYGDEKELFKKLRE